MSKYDWSNVPKDVKYLAKDSDFSFAFGFSEKPTKVRVGWIGGVVDGCLDLRLTCSEDWENSLEERPND